MPCPLITAVARRSPAGRAGVRAGMRLKAINSHPIGDVLDYRFYGYDSLLTLTLLDESGRSRDIRLSHPPGGELGLTFESGLMDKPRHCGNKCVFCFIDQQPPGLREALYFKDDDARLSFLMGNYITLTNLSDGDAARIIEQRISPIRVSVHATDPELRSLMLGNKRAGECLGMLRRFAGSGIRMHGQLVICPGLNDGAKLSETLSALASLGGAMESVAVVPVGLTGYRDGLYPLTPVTPEIARDCIERASEYPNVYCADEMFIKAGLELPDSGYYGDFAQLENGVGMTRLFIDEFKTAVRLAGELPAVRTDAALATGVAFAPFLKQLLAPYGLDGQVYAIRNDFWGHEITVAGLVTGRDLIAQLRAVRPDAGRLLIPKTMLRHDGDLFLDGLSPQEVSDALDMTVVPVETDGGALFDELFEV